MNHGGARDGAGRKPGLATKLNEEARKKAAEGGILPLDYMLDLLRNEGLPQEARFEAAKAAAPYVHARLANVIAQHDVTDALAELLKAVDGRTRGLPQSD